jgi:hypothetical protein
VDPVPDPLLLRKFAVFTAVTRRIASSGMLCPVALVRRDVSDELSASFIRVTRIDELGTNQAVTSKPRTLGRNTK